jgi:putative salt-induced outer membrane protein
MSGYYIMRTLLMRILLTAALLAFFAGSAFADDTAPSAFTGTASATYMQSTGSSNKEIFKARIGTEYKTGKWAHEFITEGLNESDNDSNIRTRERYLAQEKTSWSFTDRDYIFVKPQWEKDLQSGFEYQAFLAAGYGRKFIKSESVNLSMDFGAGTRHTKTDTNFGLGGQTDDEAMGNAALKFEWKFLSNARFTEDASAETAKNSSVYRTRSAITADMTDVLGLSIIYETKRDTGAANTDDTLTTVALSYRLK